MKNLLTLSAIALSSFAFAQTPTMNLVAEEVPILEPALTSIATQLGGTPHTYRVYAEMPDDFEMQIMYGDFTGDLNINTTTSFYQDIFGGPTTLNIDEIMIGSFPELGYDSWLTIGMENSTGNIQNIFPDETAFSAWEAGGNILINDIVGAGLFMPTVGLNPTNQADENGRVLVAQITTDGTAQICLNFQIRRLNPDGTVYDPPGPDTSETFVFNDLCVTMQPNAPEECAADLDGSGHVNTPDLLILLSNYGCTSGCPVDFNQDDATTTPDLLFMLSAFDTPC